MINSGRRATQPSSRKALVWTGRPQTLDLGPAPVRPTLTPDEQQTGRRDPRVLPSVFLPTYWIGRRVSKTSLTGYVVLSVTLAFVMLFGAVGLGFSEILFETAFGLRYLPSFPYGIPVWPFIIVGIVLQAAYILGKSKVQWTYDHHYGTSYPTFPRGLALHEKLASATLLRLILYWFLYGTFVVLDWTPLILFTYLGTYVWVVGTGSSGALQAVVLLVPVGQLLWTLFALLLVRCFIISHTISDYERIWAISGST